MLIAMNVKIFLAAMLAVAAVEARAALIVDDGQPRGRIVITDAPTRTAKLAAEQLQLYIRKMSGATLPIETQPADDAVNLYIGAAAQRVGVTAEGLRYGAFRIRSGDNWLALVGDDSEFTPIAPYRRNKSRPESQRAQDEWNKLTGENFGMPNSQLCTHQGKGFWAHDQWGSLNAVIDFLRGEGCRWYVPHEIGEVVPQQKTIALPTVDKTVEPDFALRFPSQVGRRFGNGPATMDEVLWQMRMGFYFGKDLIPMDIGHGMTRVHGHYAQEHPEWFALYGGKRETDFRNHGKPCLSSQGLLDANVRYARAVFDILDQPMISVMPSDGYVNLCECELCKGKSTPDRGWNGQLSDYVWTYVDRVARELYKTHPDRKVNCFAYGAYLLPPTTIEQFSPNVVIGIAQARRDFHDPKKRDRMNELRAAWRAKMTGDDTRFWLYEYYLHTKPTNTYGSMPVYFPHQIAADLRSLKGQCFGEFIDMSRSPEGIAWMAVDHLNLYVTSRCWWNADLDIDALLTDYYINFYGPARDQMRAFIEYCEANWMTLRDEPEKIDTVLAMLDAARETAPADSIYRKRIDWIGEYLTPLRQLQAQLAKGRDDAPAARARSGSHFDAGKITLDGKIDEAVWQDVSASALRELQTGRAPAFGTNFRMIWHDDNLYIAIACQDRAGESLNIQGDRPDARSIWNGDVVEVLIETQSHAYYQISINPAGVVADLDRKGGLKVLWSANAEVATHVADGRWSIEMRIPIADEGMNEIDPDNGVAGRRPTKVYPWYFNVCRQRVRDTGSEFTAFSPTGGKHFHDALKFAKLYVD